MISLSDVVRHFILIAAMRGSNIFFLHCSHQTYVGSALEPGETGLSQYTSCHLHASKSGFMGSSKVATAERGGFASPPLLLSLSSAQPRGQLDQFWSLLTLCRLAFSPPTAQAMELVPSSRNVRLGMGQNYLTAQGAKILLCRGLRS